jgi:hypothetical protein
MSCAISSVDIPERRRFSTSSSRQTSPLLSKGYDTSSELLASFIPVPGLAFPDTGLESSNMQLYQDARRGNDFIILDPGEVEGTDLPDLARGSATGTSGSEQTGYSCRPPLRSPT